MTNCSDDFPKTEVFYSEISGDVPIIALVVLGAVLAVVMVLVFIEETYFLYRNYRNRDRLKKVLLLLGLYPVLGLCSVVAVVVPPSTILMDLLVACYVAVCIYTFVRLVLDYFGGDAKMICQLGEEPVVLATPPCCCCCRCLPSNPLTKKSLLYLKMCALQVAVVRPVLMVIAAVLWTDGKYVQGETSPSSGYLYITVLSAISTLLSIYGMIVIFRASRLHLKHMLLGLKFLALQTVVVLVNIQSFLFGILARYDLPPCVQSRGPKVRGSNVNHAIIVIETFLLTWLARYAYRRPDQGQEMAAINTPINATNGRQVNYKAPDDTSKEEPGVDNPVYLSPYQT